MHTRNLIWGVWLVDIVVLPMGLQSRSTPSVLSLNPLLGIPCSVQWMAVSIHLCICKALAGHLKRQPYQAPFSMHFLASTIVSGFCNCIWDESPGGTVSGWSFLQIIPIILRFGLFIISFNFLDVLCYELFRFLYFLKLIY